MAALVATLALLAAHPLHTTLTQLTYRDADRSVEVMVRGFADDFRAALGEDVTDSAASAYVRSGVTIADRTGRPLPAAWCGLKRTGDVLWLCLRARAPLGPRGLRLRVALRSEEHTSELQSLAYLVCRLLLEKKKIQ